MKRDKFTIFFKRYWLYSCIGLGVIFFLYKSINKTIDSNILSSKGKIIKGVIIDKVWESSSYRNEDGYYYQFYINGQKYEGHTLDMKKKPMDSIVIIYLPDNPHVNSDYDFIKENY